MMLIKILKLIKTVLQVILSTELLEISSGEGKRYRAVSDIEASPAFRAIARVIDPNELMSAIIELIAAIVKLLNLLGVFEKSGKVALGA